MEDLNSDSDHNANKVAVFDVDGSLFRSFLLEKLIEELVVRKIFPEESIGEYQRQRENWMVNHEDYRAYTDSVLRVFQKYIKGVGYDDFNDACDKVVERNVNIVYKYTRDLINDLKKNNYFLLAVSHSPKGIVDKFCEPLGFDRVYGIFYELGPTDKFTGSVADEHVISNKGNVVRRVCQKENLSLSESFGVGDSEDDISFLEMMKRPICFNPTRELYRHAKLNHWQVVVERKGVIYEMPMT